MSRRVSGVLLLGSVVALAAALWVARNTLPVRDPGTSSPPFDVPTVVPGVLHVHSRLSDGGGTAEDVARAAADAGLRFAVLTDHGDGTRPPEPPRYVHDVLLLDGVEVSTTAGHYIGLGLPASPFPLGGDPAGVVEDVHRMGGVGVAAHPTSSKPALAWPQLQLPFDGFEWLNLDSEWRDESRRALAWAFGAYWFDGPRALASLLDRPVAALDALDRIGATRRVAVVAGADAHAGIGVRDAPEPLDPSALRLPIPTYRAAFEVARQYVELDVPLSGHAVTDASRVLEAIRHGRTFTAVTSLAPLSAFSFTAQQGRTTAPMGSEIALSDGLPTLTVTVAGPSHQAVQLLQDGVVVRSTEASTLAYEAERPGVYRVEVQVGSLPGTPPVPWLVSNPIFVRAALPKPEVDRPAPATRFDLLGGAVWHVEGDGASTAALAASPGGGADFTYSLATAAETVGPWVALVAELPTALKSEWGGFVLEARAHGPLRPTVQIRAAGESGRDWRWRRSFRLESTTATLTLRVSEFQRIGPEVPSLLPMHADHVMLVVDSVNNMPGSRGTIHLDRFGAY